MVDLCKGRKEEGRAEKRFVYPSIDYIAWCGIATHARVKTKSRLARVVTSRIPQIKTDGRSSRGPVPIE